MKKIWRVIWGMIKWSIGLSVVFVFAAILAFSFEILVIKYLGPQYSLLAEVILGILLFVIVFFHATRTD